MVSKRTIQRRIKKGMTREQAAKIPPYFSKLTVDNVLKVREHGLSIGKSAFILSVETATLSRFIEKNKVDWPNKGILLKKGDRNPNSLQAKAEKAGLTKSAVEKHVYKKGLSVDDAIECCLRNKAKREAKNVKTD